MGWNRTLLVGKFPSYHYHMPILFIVKFLKRIFLNNANGLSVLITQIMNLCTLLEWEIERELERKFCKLFGISEQISHICIITATDIHSLTLFSIVFFHSFFYQDYCHQNFNIKFKTEFRRKSKWLLMLKFDYIQKLSASHPDQ